jgi:hypothetical protein
MNFGIGIGPKAVIVCADCSLATALTTCL